MVPPPLPGGVRVGCGGGGGNAAPSLCDSCTSCLFSFLVCRLKMPPCFVLSRADGIFLAAPPASSLIPLPTHPLMCVCNKYEGNVFLSRCVLTPAVPLSALWNRVWLLIHANSGILAGLNSFGCFSSASSSESRHRGSIQSMLEHHSLFSLIFFCAQYQPCAFLSHLFLQDINGCRLRRQVGS